MLIPPISDSSAPSAHGTRRIGFLLTPGFAMLAFSSAIEPLRAANRLLDRAAYQWRIHTADGTPATASNGIAVVPHAGLEASLWPQAVFVCAGLDPHLFDDRRANRWLQGHAARGIVIGALSTGSHVLARAGLLAGHRCTVHWEHAAVMREQFPEVAVTDGLYEVDRQRWSCAGGTAALDMMLHLIAADHGPELAVAVSDQFIHDRLRTPGVRQRRAGELRLNGLSPKLAAAIRIMEANVENPLPQSEIATRIGLSTRQLERLFRQYRGCSPRSHYLDIRLRHARLLLLQTTMPVLDIALASGFVTQSHFTKRYREHFGHTPSVDRGRRVPARGPDPVMPPADHAVAP